MSVRDVLWLKDLLTVNLKVSLASTISVQISASNITSVWPTTPTLFKYLTNAMA